MTMARCEDYPCCGHTDGLPCDWTPPDYSKDPHLLCDHAAGVCDVYEDDDDDSYYENADDDGTDITAQDIEAFTHGACYLLAQALHEGPGWPVAAFWDGFRPAGHVFNQLPDGRYIDITGVRTHQEMLRTHWAQPGKRHGRRGVTVQHASTDGWQTSQDETALAARARALIPALIALAGHLEQETAPHA